MTPDWQTDDGRIQLYCGDCLKILPEIGPVGAVITDPPYGIAKDRFRAGPPSGKGIAKKRDHWSSFSKWDTERPSKEVFNLILSVSNDSCFWGGNYFADLLPASMGWLFWDKKNDGLSFANGELAWTSRHQALRTKRHLWNGCIRAGEKFEYFHPTQKPVELMIWSMEIIKTPQTAIILDPFMGSGTTGIACIRTGRKFIGIEISPDYFKISVDRIKVELQQGLLKL